MNYCYIHADTTQTSRTAVRRAVSTRGTIWRRITPTITGHNIKLCCQPDAAVAIAERLTSPHTQLYLTASLTSTFVGPVRWRFAPSGGCAYFAFTSNGTDSQLRYSSSQQILTAPITLSPAEVEKWMQQLTVDIYS